MEYQHAAGVWRYSGEGQWGGAVGRGSEISWGKAGTNLNSLP